MIDWRVALAGFVVGIVAGISGVGGSALLAPALILLLGVKPTIAVGVDLLYGVPTKVLAAVVHGRQGTIDRSIIGPLVTGGVPGACVGLAAFAALRVRIPAGQFQLVMRHAIGVAILLACVLAIVMTVIRATRGSPVRRAVPRSDALIGAGFAVGVLVSVTSIGSGSVMLPVLLLVAGSIPLRKLVGSEIVLAAAVLPVAAAGHAAFGNVDWTLTASLLVGSLPGVALGSRLCAVVDERALRPVVLTVLAYAGYRLL